MSANLRKKAERCRGCYNDAYNHGLGGATQCWSLPGATLVTNIEVSVDKRPPYLSEKPQRRFRCYRRQRCAYLSPEQAKKTNAFCAAYDKAKAEGGAT